MRRAKILVVDDRPAKEIISDILKKIAGEMKIVTSSDDGELFKMTKRGGIKSKKGEDEYSTKTSQILRPAEVRDGTS